MSEPTPQPSHLNTRDPMNADVRDIRVEADREIDHYADQDRPDLVLLMPEDRWEDFLRMAEVEAGGEDEATYRGVTFRKAAVTAVIAQDGF
jgi:hypothetical protein